MNSGGDAEKQSNKEILVYSRKPKLKYRENLIPEAPRDSKPMIALSNHESSSNPNQVIDSSSNEFPSDKSEPIDIDLPLLSENKLGHVFSILFQNSYLITLSTRCCVFTSNLDSIKISKNIQEAL